MVCRVRDIIVWAKLADSAGLKCFVTDYASVSGNFGDDLIRQFRRLCGC
jgi:hypothetical protein